MKMLRILALLLLLFTVNGVTVLQLNKCRDAKHATMEFKVCEKLNQYEQMNKQNRNLGIKGRPTKRDRRDLGKWFN